MKWPKIFQALKEDKIEKKERIRGSNRNMVDINLYTPVQIQRLTDLLNNIRLIAISRGTSKTWGYRRVDYKRTEKDRSCNTNGK